MESKAKFLGHPVHQMLIVFPVGLLVASVIFDVLYLITGNDVFPIIAFYNIAGGLIGGVLAAIFGLIDFLAIPGQTRAKRIGLLHGLGNLVVVVLFSLSWVIRRSLDGFVPDTMALLLSFLGVGLAGVTAWMGGELVDRLGVGVDPGANLNAPSSLTTESVRPMQREQIPVTGEHRDLEPQGSIHVSPPEPIVDEGEPESTGRIIDEP